MLTLTPIELAELTGRIQPAAQIRWLKERNWRYEIGGDGLPKVAIAYFEKRMVSGDDAQLAEPTESQHNKEWQVNIAALTGGRPITTY